jgi:hypothetical protein
MNLYSQVAEWYNATVDGSQFQLQRVANFESGCRVNLRNRFESCPDRKKFFETTANRH